MYLSTTEDKLPDLFPMFFLLCSYSFLLSYPGSATIYKTDGKEKTKEDNDVKETYTFDYPLYICGSYTSAAAVIEVRCSLYPNIHPPLLGMTITPPSCIRVNTAEHGTSPLFIMDDLCHTLTTLCFYQSVLSVAVIEGTARLSVTNRYPIVDILCLITVEILFFFNCLSKVRLLLLGIDTRPQANASLRLY